MKIKNDKYYTPIEIANKCWQTVGRVIGWENISNIVEPSCGNGAFCHYDKKPDILIDIEPEIINAVKADYLKYKIPYKKGRLVIGNPPFGERLKLAQDFYNKSCDIADYIAFILPITQKDNTSSLYRFNLIYSEDLGEEVYSGIKLHCCFNIYKRPESGALNSRTADGIKGIKIYRSDTAEYDYVKDYDVRMCSFGSGTCGKILTVGDKRYCGEYKIKIKDEHPQKKKILEILKTTDWNTLTVNIATKMLKQYTIYEVLRKNGIMDLDLEQSLF